TGVQTCALPILVAPDVVAVTLDFHGPLSDDLVATQKTKERGPMETFRKLFASLLVFVYHCFDRVVIQGYLPLLTRPEHIVFFFRDVHGIYPITNQALRPSTRDYQPAVQPLP